MSQNFTRKLRTQQIIADLQTHIDRAGCKTSEPLIINDLSSFKRNFLDTIYRKDLVEVSWYSRTLSDKYLGWCFLNQISLEKTKKFFPKTSGTRELLEKHPFISQEKLEDLLLKENFHVIKPTCSYHSLGNNIIFGANNIAKFMAKNIKSFGYNPFRVNNDYGQLIPEHYILTSFVKQRAMRKLGNEFRVHSYEGNVINDASFVKWYSLPIEPAVQKGLHAFTQEFLDCIPKPAKAKQAWSFDIVLDNNNSFFIVDLNTNRGVMKSWSANIQDPTIMLAYQKHFENNCNVTFEGIGSDIIRSGLGNIYNFLNDQILSLHEAIRSPHLSRSGLIARARHLIEKYDKLIRINYAWLVKDAPWIQLEVCKEKLLPDLEQFVFQHEESALKEPDQ